MSGWDEDTALSLLFANTKRKKRAVDLITLAKATEYLVQLYGSRKAVADKTGLSTEMVREFLLPLKLPERVRRMVADREIDRLDVVRELASLGSSEDQIAAAEAVATDPSKDVRDIKRLVKRAGLKVPQAREVVLEAKPKGLHIFVLDFDDETYSAIIRLAKASGKSPAEFVRDIVVRAVQTRGEEEG